jgi:predicted membrane metal-binding protein
MQSHEQLDREHEVATSSERSFGFVFATVFALVGAWQLWHARADGPWWFAAAAAFALLALLRPALLAPLNRLWARFGLFLHGIVNPVMMGLLFAVAILPVGLLMRLAGKDPLRLRFEPGADSYWVACDPPDRPDAMKDQF